ncbi:unnamed protein product [Mytilus edulis]|uniref:Uncharacterized protein n=1 Tax=Mytilus edulis TaxID=6550 RepID=A0A8S3R3E5_MYTED|nr:unnamed protein product [Mytilus edulis]
MRKLLESQRFLCTVMVLLTVSLFAVLCFQNLEDHMAAGINRRFPPQDISVNREEESRPQTREENPLISYTENDNKQVPTHRDSKLGQTCENEDDFEQWICENEHDFDRLSKRLAKTKVGGHIFMRDSITLELTKKPQLRAVYEYIQQNMKHASRFCETGFNGGHSSMMWAKLFLGKIEIISFDMCYNNGGCDIGLEEIHRLYPDMKHTLIRGDSTINLPNYTKENPNIKCDFIFVDGGHIGDVPEKDLYNFKPMAKDNHIVVMDDCVWNLTNSDYTNWIGKAINKGVEDKLICPITCKPMYIPKMKRNTSTCFHKYCK